LRGIPWLLILVLTLQPGIIWKDVQYDQLLEPEPPTKEQGSNVEKQAES